MNTFRISITAENGDIDIYTNASKIEIVNDLIEIDYEDRHATHPLDEADEIVINANR